MKRPIKPRVLEKGFKPTREYIEEMTKKYLAAGGKIEKLEPRWTDLDLTNISATLDLDFD